MGKRADKTMRSKIFVGIFFTALAAMVMLAGILSSVMYEKSSEELKAEVKAETLYIAEALNRLDGIDAYLTSIGADSANRITLIASDGTPIYDSAADVSLMDNHLSRPEVESARTTGSGEAVRSSDTLGKQTYYYAMATADGSIIRVANTGRSSMSAIGNAVGAVLFTSLVLTAAAFIVALVISDRIIKPINRLNLREPLKNHTYEELSPLLNRIESLNRESENQMKSLKSSRDEFEYITAQMSEGLVMISDDRLVMFANAVAKRILVQLLDGSGKKLNPSSQIDQAVNSALGGETCKTRLEQNGRVYSVTVSPVAYGDGSYSAVAFIVDVTDTERAEQMRREFSANVSHELKTPLTSILGCAEIISNGVAKPEDIPRFAEQIHSEANRLLALIGDIIKLSRLDEQDLRAQFETVDLSEVCKTAVNELSDKAKAARVKLSCDCDHAKLTGFRPVLHEMVYNLCDNAVKYNKPDGSVNLTLKTSGDKITLTVADTGIGIPSEHQSRVFERFYRVDKSHSRETGGTGLGLSIVKHGAALHNASLNLSSEPDKGTTVTMVFPIGQ